MPCIDAITTQEFSILTKDFIDKFQGQEQIEPGVEGRGGHTCKSACYRAELGKFRSDLYELLEFRPFSIQESVIFRLRTSKTAIRKNPPRAVRRMWRFMKFHVTCILLLLPGAEEEVVFTYHRKK